MNAVYLSGWLNSPIVVVSGENADYHVKTTIKPGFPEHSTMKG